MFWNNLGCYLNNLGNHWQLPHYHGLPEFASGLPLGGGSDTNFGKPCTLIHNLPCRTPCGLFIHKLSFGPLGLHLLVWIELGQSPQFLLMRALTLQWSWAFSLVCEVALSIDMVLGLYWPKYQLGYIKVFSNWDTTKYQYVTILIIPIS
jgi:hypothetical protein